MPLTPYPNPLPRRHHARTDSWKLRAAWLLLSLLLGTAWFAVCRLVQLLMP